MPKLCICQICTCGRHHCPRKHTRDTIPGDGEGGDYWTEMRRAYQLKDPSARRKPRKPKPEIGLPTGTMAKASTAMQDYTPKKIPPRFVRQKVKYKPPESKMYCTSTYRKDYEERKLLERERPIRHDQNLVIPSDKMEFRTTQNRDYVLWDRRAAEACRAKPVKPPDNNLGVRDQEFAGQSETMRSYKKPPPILRVKGTKKLDNLHTEGKFEGVPTYAVDYPPRKLEPRQSFKPKQGSIRWPDDHIKSHTTYKTDYKPHERKGRRKPYGPREAQIKPPDAPFDANTSYKTDYPAHLMHPRETPPWKPKKQYEKPEVPFSGDTTHRKDYRCPPEDLLPEKGKPLRSNLTVGGDPMATITTHRLDYTYPEGFEPSKSTKVKDDFVPPTKPMASETTTRHDYTDKHGTRSLPIKYTGNIGFSGDPMDLLTMNKKDYRCQKIDCPVARLKMGDEEVRSQYKFVESTQNHEYYQTIRPKKKKDAVQSEDT